MKRERRVNSAQTEFRDPTVIPEAMDRSFTSNRSRDFKAREVSDVHKSTNSQVRPKVCGGKNVGKRSIPVRVWGGKDAVKRSLGSESRAGETRPPGPNS